MYCNTYDCLFLWTFIDQKNCYHNHFNTNLNKGSLCYFGEIFYELSYCIDESYRAVILISRQSQSKVFIVSSRFMPAHFIFLNSFFSHYDTNVKQFWFVYFFYNAKKWQSNIRRERFYYHLLSIFFHGRR